MQIAALIIDSFRHALDKKLFWVMLAISTVVALSFFTIRVTASGGLAIMGLPEFDVDGRAMAGLILTKVVSDYYVGWIGTILALIATAGVIPAFLEQGSVDVVLSKPITRAKLFLGKYLGCMAFTTLQVSYFVILTFFIAGNWWGFWIWGYLWAIPLVILMFSYLFAFCALFGVLTRSALASLLFTGLIWVAIVCVQAAHVYTQITNPWNPQQNKPLIQGTWATAIQGAYTVLPKTNDLSYIAQELSGAASIMDVLSSPQFQETQEQQLRGLEEINIPWSIGTSLACEAAALGLAMFIFWRRDY